MPYPGGSARKTNRPIHLSYIVKEILISMQTKLPRDPKNCRTPLTVLAYWCAFVDFLRKVATGNWRWFRTNFYGVEDNILKGRTVPQERGLYPTLQKEREEFGGGGGGGAEGRQWMFWRR